MLQSGIRHGWFVNKLLYLVDRLDEVKVVRKKTFLYYLLIIRAFLYCAKTFLKNNTWNVCRIQKMPYLCIAFETEVYGRLAQLVQSICLTSRGSAVRIRQRPHKKRNTSGSLTRAFSSAGSEHLPYKQRVGGSNPSTPTTKQSLTKKFVRLFLFLTSFIQTFFLLLSYNSGKRVNFAVW